MVWNNTEPNNGYNIFFLNIDVLHYLNSKLVILQKYKCRSQIVEELTRIKIKNWTFN